MIVFRNPYSVESMNLAFMHVLLWSVYHASRKLDEILTVGIEICERERSNKSLRQIQAYCSALYLSMSLLHVINSNVFAPQRNGMFVRPDDDHVFMVDRFAL